MLQTTATSHGDYTQAPQTKMLEARCAICSRDLCDSISVEVGMGPTCRERHGYNAEVAGLDAESRKSANAIVYKIATNWKDDSVRLAGCAALKLMGFTKLAERILHKGKDAPKGEVVEIEAFTLPKLETWGGRTLPAIEGFLVWTPYSKGAVDAWRSIPGRRWNKEQKANFIPAVSNGQLWRLLKTFFGGSYGTGPKGDFKIPG